MTLTELYQELLIEVESAKIKLSDLNYTISELEDLADWVIKIKSAIDPLAYTIMLTCNEYFQNYIIVTGEQIPFRVEMRKKEGEDENTGKNLSTEI